MVEVGDLATADELHPPATPRNSAIIAERQVGRLGVVPGAFVPHEGVLGRVELGPNRPRRPEGLVDLARPSLGDVRVEGAEDHQELAPDLAGPVSESAGSEPSLPLWMPVA